MQFFNSSGDCTTPLPPIPLTSAAALGIGVLASGANLDPSMFSFDGNNTIGEYSSGMVPMGGAVVMPSSTMATLFGGGGTGSADYYLACPTPLKTSAPCQQPHPPFLPVVGDHQARTTTENMAAAFAAATFSSHCRAATATLAASAVAEQQQQQPAAFAVASSGPSIFQPQPTNNHLKQQHLLDINALTTTTTIPSLGGSLMRLQHRDSENVAPPHPSVNGGVILDMDGNRLQSSGGCSIPKSAAMFPTG